MARSVLDRVAGDVEWVDTSGDPWLPEESPVRRVHANAAMLVGGIRALLLQSLHPVAMQAVEDHSGRGSARVVPVGGTITILPTQGC